MTALYESPTFWYCVMTLVVGCAALFAVFLLGKFLAERSVLGGWRPSSELVDKLLAYYEKLNLKAGFHRHLAEANRDYLQRRNEFWTTYLQVVVAILIVVVLALLLITKTISAEAGLPILAAVAGFAISKSAASHGSGGTEIDRQA